MKYIRTKDGRILGYNYVKSFPIEFKVKEGFTKEQVLQELEEKSDVIKVADTIEELCDEFIVAYEDGNKIVYQDLEWATTKASTSECKSIIYGAIWTDKGLIYVAKMNEKGELELL